jgi:beta-phosphoglucomutase family hydrolase
VAPAIASYSGLIFDFDGTLVDTGALHFRTWAQVLRDHGVELDEVWFDERRGLAGVELIRQLNEHYAVSLEVANLSQRKQRLYAELVHTVKEITVVADIVRAHHRKVPMAVASANVRPQVVVTLRAMDLLNYFDAIVTSEDVRNHKPEPDLFLLAAERLHAEPARCLVYEDSEEGLEAARRAGMAVIDVRELIASTAPMKSRSMLLAALARCRPVDAVEAAMIDATRNFVRSNQRCFERSCQKGHVTGSAWVIDRERSHALLTHHAKLGKWLQLGGHADGEADVMHVALREAAEESGLRSLHPLCRDIFDIDVHQIPARAAEPAHLHYDIRFLLEADRQEPFTISTESRALAWVDLDRISELNATESILRMVRKTHVLRT